MKVTDLVLRPLMFISGVFLRLSMTEEVLLQEWPKNTVDNVNRVFQASELSFSRELWESTLESLRPTLWAFPAEVQEKALERCRELRFLEY